MSPVAEEKGPAIGWSPSSPGSNSPHGDTVVVTLIVLFPETPKATAVLTVGWIVASAEGRNPVCESADAPLASEDTVWSVTRVAAAASVTPPRSAFRRRELMILLLPEMVFLPEHSGARRSATDR
jgi:hypothetical protein